MFETVTRFSGQEFKLCSSDENDYIFDIVKRSAAFYEMDLLGFLAMLPLEPGGVVDVGANIGNHTVFFSGVLQRKVWAIEPSTSSFESLSATVDANRDVLDVVLKKVGLGSEPKNAVLRTPDENRGMAYICESDEVVDAGDELVRIERLDDLLPSTEDIALIKVDVEGFEVEVLKGAVKTLERCQPLIVVECLSQEAVEEIDKQIGHQGYRPIGSGGRSPTFVYCHEKHLEKLLHYARVAHHWMVQKTGESASIRFAVSETRRSLEKEIAQLSKEREVALALEGERAILKDELAAAKSELARLTEVTAELAIARREIKRLNRDRNALDLQLAELSGQSNRADQLEFERSAALEEADRLRVELKAAKAIETELITARHEIQLLEAKNKATEASRARFSQLSRKHKADLEHARSSIESREKALEEQAREVASQSAELIASEAFEQHLAKNTRREAQLTNKIALLESSLEQSKAELEQSKAEFEEQKNALQSELFEVKSVAAAYARKIGQQRAAYAERSALLEQARATSLKMRDQRDAAYARLADKTPILRSAVTRLSSMVARVPGARAMVRKTVPRNLRQWVFDLSNPPAARRTSALDVLKGDGARPAAQKLDQRGSEPTRSKPKKLDSGHLSGDTNFDCALVCASYPGGKREYGGDFVHSRLAAYKKEGLNPLVIEASALNTETWENEIDEIKCVRAHPSDLAEILNKVPGAKVHLTHSPSPEMIDLFAQRKEPLIAWLHGYEVRDYRRLFFNYGTPEMELLRAKLDAVNVTRFSAARKLFSDRNVHKVFVSNYIRGVAEADVGVKAGPATIIPNYIDTEHYVARDKGPALSKKILLIRSFAARNYANDLATEAIQILRQRKGFDQLEFTICGFGGNFEKLTEPLAKLDNVVLEEGVLDREQMKRKHEQHGVFLAPTRFDTQGVTLGEAMSSGMACITNPVTGIPEFCDEDSVRFARPDDPAAFAEEIWKLAHDPGEFLRLSRGGAKRVRSQCSAKHTIQKELKLIRNILATTE